MKKQVASDLIQLIRSLTPAEKRSFQLTSTRYQTDQPKGKKYLSLYEKLEALRDGDAMPEVQEDNADYLINLLTESLVHQHRDIPELDLRYQLSAATVLYRRGLEKRGQRMFEKLHAYALESGMYEFGLEAINIHMHLHTSVDDLAIFERLTKQKSHLLDLVGLYQKYDEALIQIFSAFKNNDEKRVRKIIATPLFQKPAKDRKSEIQRAYLLAHVAMTFKELDKCEKYQKILIHRFEESSAYLSLRMYPYIIVVLNYGLWAFKSNKPNEVLKAIDSLKQLPKRVAGFVITIDHDRLKRYMLDLQLRYNLLIQNPEGALKLMPEVKHCLAHDLKIEPYRINYLRYFMALALVNLQRYKEALVWLQPIIDEKRKGYYNQKTYSLSFLLRAKCHQLLGNEDISEPMIRSFRRTRFFEPSRVHQQFQGLLGELSGKGMGDWFL